MRNNMKNKFLIFIICLGLLLTIGTFYSRTSASSSEPGTITDPLVTKSYVDEANKKLIQEVEALISQKGSSSTQPTNMTEIYKYIDNKLAGIATNGVNVSDGFIVLDAAPGKKVIGESSCEMIVRSGEVKAIGNTLGDGLSDVTEGRDIKDGEIVPNNHLLIIPRTDGRGLLIEKKSFIMIKGNYILQ